MEREGKGICTEVLLGPNVLFFPSSLFLSYPLLLLLLLLPCYTSSSVSLFSFIIGDRDALTEVLSLNVLQHILFFLPPVVLRFASLTCSFWRHTIRFVLLFSSLFSSSLLCSHLFLSFLSLLFSVVLFFSFLLLSFIFSSPLLSSPLLSSPLLSSPLLSSPLLSSPIFSSLPFPSLPFPSLLLSSFLLFF